ncbi:hypothetical protein WICPIJ_003992 [Wickerhamomyces pijperi]|uniref:Uncharacterized protein n=1 Tax=Wickerhamomyces pijperi TaxID=599730 RepID=A0A9P8TNC7_WICPI|nr:hypothetical protein WICPIJ_003992 [Wickerhamomyces pijperi]
MIKVLPCSMTTLISSPIFGGAKKALVGRTDKSPYCSLILRKSSYTLGNMLYEAMSHSEILLNLEDKSSSIFLKSKGANSKPGLTSNFLLLPLKTSDLKGSGNPPNHELGQITNNLGSWSDLNQITKQQVGFAQIGQLTTWDFMLVNFRVWTLQVGFEARVQQSHLGPVGVHLSNVVDIDTGLDIGAVQRGQKSRDRRLRGQTGQRVGGDIDNIGTGFSTGSHRGNTGTSGVMGVDVDWQVWVLGSDGTDQQLGGLWLQSTSHVLDTQDVGTSLDDLLGDVQVVVQVVLLAWLQHVTGVTDSGLDNTASLLDSLDTNLQLFQVVQSVKHSEDINTVVLGHLDEMVNGVVWQRGVG